MVVRLVVCKFVIERRRANVCGSIIEGEIFLAVLIQRQVSDETMHYCYFFFKQKTAYEITR